MKSLRCTFPTLLLTLTWILPAPAVNAAQPATSTTISASAFGAAERDEFLSGPLALDMDIVVTAQVDEVLSGAALAQANRSAGMPEDTSPTLKLWSADFQNHFGQQRIELVDCVPPPTRVEVEPENGNRIMLWDLSPSLESSRTLTVRRHYRLTNFNFDPRVTTESVPAKYAPGDPRVAFYTKSEPYLEQTDDITSAARIAVGDATHPFDKARRIFRYVRQHMTYEYPPPGGRGATIALAKGRGDCGQHADLFVAMCRAAGVPARMGAGFMLELGKGDDHGTTAGCHAWAELLLPDGRWVPVDATGDEENYFARKLANTHLTASVGRNIPLPDVPSYARYSNSDVENGRTDFMQTYTEFKSGIRANVSATRTVKR